MSEEIYMSQKGLEEMKERLKYLKTVKRQEIVERIQEARSHGDLSENAEYEAARNEQAANEGEILELENQVKNAIILPENTDTSTVHIGSEVKVYDVDMEEEAVYTITGTTEADAAQNKISNESPVGQALLKHKVGDVVTVKAPECDYLLKILEITIPQN
ncbi:MAG: transcription elongation factor GreA [Clostridia bacterium]|nr:transcription elongation factor GreA [Clostridia bacterium]